MARSGVIKAATVRRGPERRARVTRAVAWPLALALAVGGCSLDRGSAGATTLASTVPAGQVELAPHDKTEDATVVRVIDGDTIDVRLRDRVHRVRYIGIDAPETGRGEAPAEPFGREATELNGDLVGGQDVILEKDVSETDRFGRLLRYVWLRDDGAWTFVNRELVVAGLAESRRYRPDTARQGILDDALEEARAAGRGQWQGP